MPNDIRVDFDVQGAIPIIALLETASDELKGKTTYAVGTPLQYGIYQEFGTFRHPPQPFLRPATRSAIRRWESFFDRADEIDEAIKLIAKDIEQGAKRRAPVRTGRLRDSIHTRKVK